MDDSAARAAIVAACRRMEALGINQGSSGNVSVRTADGLLITPSGLAYDAMGADDIVALDRDGAPIGAAQRRPSSEWRLHRDILAARPEFGAVVHAHPTHCIAVSILRPTIPPIHYMIAAAGGSDIRVAPYATFGTAALSDLAVAALEGRAACLLAHHGMIALGRDLGAALALAVEVEALARQYLACLAAAGGAEPPVLTGEQIADAIARFGAGYGQA